MRKKSVLASVLAAAAALVLSVGGAGVAQAAPGEPTAAGYGVRGAWSYTQSRLYVQDAEADGFAACSRLEQWVKVKGEWKWVILDIVFDTNGANGDSPSIYVPTSGIRHDKNQGNLRVTAIGYKPSEGSLLCSVPGLGSKSVEFRAY